MVLRWRDFVRLGLIGALLVLAQGAIADTRSPANQTSILPAQQQPAPALAKAGLPRQQSAPASSDDFLTAYRDRAERLIGDARRWLADSYKHSPVAVAGLTILAILPLLALPAWLFWLGSALQRRIFRQSAATASFVDQPAGMMPSLSTAWLEIALPPGSATRLPLDRPMLRIGRNGENDICLPDASVQGYHALIHWSPEEAFQIRDLTAAEETGVLVNGRAVGAAPLRKGDLIELGDVRMLFATVHA